MKSTTLSFNELQVEGYERVIEVKDPEAELHAIIALHDTRLGPAVGGTRAYPYPSFEDALEDVLRLSKGMTYKAAVAETGTGGGKSVIILKPSQKKTEALLHAFAEAVNALEGGYICAEDVGMTVDDLARVNKYTPYAVGLPRTSGDPSRFTSRGGFRGIQAVCQKLWGTPSPAGRTIAIQGLGAVGMKLAAYLFWEGARLIVTDVNPERVTEAVKAFGAKAVEPDQILSTPCDIFAPCALGGILNAQTIPHLQCKAVAGLANNQLLEESDGEALYQHGILYAPDYVINMGGLLNVCTELEPGGYDAQLAREKVDRIFDLLMKIFTLAEEKGQSPRQSAKDIAEYNLEHGIGKRLHPLVFPS